MLIIRGSSALSEFRTEKLLRQCTKNSIDIDSISAEYVHYVDSSVELGADEVETLEKLLSYGPKSDTIDRTGTPVIVVPRPGTISPWSTRQTLS